MTSKKNKVEKKKLKKVARFRAFDPDNDLHH